MFKFKFFDGIILAFVVLVCMFPNILAAEIKVYDNSNQYLGILIDMEGQQNTTVFIPSINASFRFEKYRLENPNKCYYNSEIVFESDDCSGVPYSYGPFPFVIDLKFPPYDGYYLPDLNSRKQFEAKSYQRCDMAGNFVCNEYQIVTSNMFYYEIKEIQLPFTTPIFLPVRFEENVSNNADFFVIPIKKK